MPHFLAYCALSEDVSFGSSPNKISDFFWRRIVYLVLEHNTWRMYYNDSDLLHRKQIESWCRLKHAQNANTYL